jgi:hypothetical protein
MIHFVFRASEQTKLLYKYSCDTKKCHWCSASFSACLSISVNLNLGPTYFHMCHNYNYRGLQMSLYHVSMLFGENTLLSSVSRDAVRARCGNMAFPPSQSWPRNKIISNNIDIIISNGYL